ncbi:sensor histidine kinase, partial [Staphylococcus hyicus]
MAYHLAQRPIKVYEQLIQEQRVFIQNASHEMKQPIASLLLGTQYIEILDSDHLSVTSRQTFAQIKLKVTDMQKTIDPLLKTHIRIKKNKKNPVGPILCG